PLPLNRVSEIAACVIVIPIVSDGVPCAVIVSVEVRVVKELARSRAEHLESEDRFLIEFQSTVNSANLVVLLYEVVASCDHAERRLFAHVALEPQNADIRVLAHELGYVFKDGGVVSI